jgi:hypothetical protein
MYQTDIKSQTRVTGSVADPGCLSQIPDPDFYPSRIPGLGSRIQKQQQKRGVKKISCHTFLCSHKFHKLKIILVLKCWRKKFGPISKNYKTFYPKNFVTKLSKIWVWDPGSGIRDPGSGKNLFRTQIQGSKRHRIPDPDPQHWLPVLDTYIYHVSVQIRANIDRGSLNHVFHTLA